MHAKLNISSCSHNCDLCVHTDKQPCMINNSSFYLFNLHCIKIDSKKKRERETTKSIGAQRHSVGVDAI